MTERIVLSIRSLLMLLYSAIGDGGNLDRPVLQDLVFFYSFNQFIASPARIKAELERAKNLGFIEIDSTTSRVSFTEKGSSAVNEHGITMDSFTNPKFRVKRELEAKAKKTADQMLARQIRSKIDALSSEIDREHLLWRGPPEWGHTDWNSPAKPAEGKRKEIVVASDLKITKAPPKPRRIG